MKRAIALLVGATLVMGMMAPSAAALTIATTTLRLRVSDQTPEFRTEVTFTARLSSNRKACFAKRPVKLFRNGERVRSKQTNGEGVVKWKITIRANGQWQARFAGRTFPHPNDLVCEESESKIIRVRVQNKP